jgi:Flp pilus assembly protein TadG
VQFVLTLPVLLGMTGLVIDSGMLMATQRTAQNAADAGALAAAMDLYRGASVATATTTGTTFIQNYNGLSNATVTMNSPPASGPYINNSRYCEVIVSLPYTASFIQVVGLNSGQNVSARAVAGYETFTTGDAAFVLRTDAIPGISMNGNNTRLMVNGGVVVNSQGGGVDQYGNTVSGSGNAVTTQQGMIIAQAVQVVVGVDNVDNFRVYNGVGPNYYDPSNPDRPLFARAPVAPDPLASLPTPTTSNGVVATYWNYLGNGQWGTASSPQAISIKNKDTVTFSPGIYGPISFNGGTVTFNSGIYVIAGGGISFGGNETITDNGAGVMIYNTGSDYDPTTGAPDNADGSTLGTDSNANFGGVSMSGNPTISLSPINNSSSPFNGMLFYQRRWNAVTNSFVGNGTGLNFSGTLYDKWGAFSLSGQGQYTAQFVVGSLSLSGNGNITITAPTGSKKGVNQVFLVE